MLQNRFFSWVTELKNKKEFHCVFLMLCSFEGDTLIVLVIEVMAISKPVLQNCKEFLKNPPLYQQEQIQSNWEQCFSRAGKASPSPTNYGQDALSCSSIPSPSAGRLYAVDWFQAAWFLCWALIPFAVCSKGRRPEHSARGRTIQSLLNLFHLPLVVPSVLGDVTWVRERKEDPPSEKLLLCVRCFFRAWHGSLLKWMSSASTVCHRSGEGETFWADVTCPGTNYQEVNSKHHATSSITMFFLLDFLFSFSKFC